MLPDNGKEMVSWIIAGMMHTPVKLEMQPPPSTQIKTANPLGIIDVSLLARRAVNAHH